MRADVAPTTRASTDEQRLRVELAALHRILALREWDDHIFTHLSARVPGADPHMLVAPLGALFSEVTATSLIRTTFDGETVDGSDQPLNRGAVVIHGGVYALAPHVQCVVHLHTVANVAVSASPSGLLPISQAAMGLTGKVAYHDYEGLAIHVEERARMVERLGTKRVLILRNHGSLICARNIAEAHDDTYTFERACEMQVAALASGGASVIACSPEVAAATAADFDYDPRMTTLSWAAVMRRVRRESPGFDD